MCIRDSACSHRAEPEQADADGHACETVKVRILEMRGGGHWHGGRFQDTGLRSPGFGGGCQGAGLGLHHPQDVEETVGP